MGTTARFTMPGGLRRASAALLLGAALLSQPAVTAAKKIRSSTSNCSAVVPICSEAEEKAGKCSVYIEEDFVMDVGLPLMVIVLMMGMGATISMDQMRRVFKKPGGVFIGIISQFGLMPLLAFILTRIFGLCPAQSIGMLVVGSTAGGTTSNLFAFWSGGDVALSITMTSISNLCAMFMQPALLYAYASAIPELQEVQFQVPVSDLVTTLIGGILIPVSIGMTINYYSKAWGMYINRIGSLMGILVVLILIVYAAITMPELFASDGAIYGCCIIIGFSGFFFGMGLSAIAGLDRKQIRTVGLETGIQNGPVAITVVYLCFKRYGQQLLDDVLVFPYLYSFFIVCESLLVVYPLRQMREPRTIMPDQKLSKKVEKGDEAPVRSLVFDSDQAPPAGPRTTCAFGCEAPQKPAYCRSLEKEPILNMQKPPAGTSAEEWHKRGLVTTIGPANLWESFSGTAERQPNFKCFGRRVVRKHKGTCFDNGCCDAGQTEFDHFAWTTYGEAREQAINLGRFLRNDCGVAKGGFVGIFGRNREEWVIASEACNAFGMVSVPLYDTLGAEALEHIVNETEMTTVVVESEIVERQGSKLQKVLDAKQKCPSLANAVAMRDRTEAYSAVKYRCEGRMEKGKGKRSAKCCSLEGFFKCCCCCLKSAQWGDQEAIAEMQDNLTEAVNADAGALCMQRKNNFQAGADAAGVKLYMWEDALRTGATYKDEPSPGSWDDVATICYTSGTTGNPKGAVLSHGNILSDYHGLVFSGVDFRGDDRHISYLPLAHMFERTVISGVLHRGAEIAFYSGNVKYLMDDIMLAQPTIFVSVPRLLNRLYNRIISTMSGPKPTCACSWPPPALQKAMFWKGLKAKTKLLEQNIYEDGFWDSVVFTNIAKRLGGQVRLIATGSAPIDKDVINFLRMAFSCSVQEGYGQTECGAASNCTVWGDCSVGHVGPPIPCCEQKLESVPDMNYLASNNQGEVCIRGPNVFRGYYKDAAPNPVDEDGWLHTGDIGQWTEAGCLKIIDRKKNLFKLSQGEYVAPEKVENAYAACPYVAQSFVYGDSTKDCTVAVIVVNIDDLRKDLRRDEKAAGTSAAKSGDEATSPGDVEMVALDNDVAANAALLKSDKAVKKVMNALNEIKKSAKLNSVESVKEIFLTDEEFTVDNDLVTPTFKLKRQQLRERYQSEIEAMYAQNAQKMAGRH